MPELPLTRTYEADTLECWQFKRAKGPRMSEETAYLFGAILIAYIGMFSYLVRLMRTVALVTAFMRQASNAMSRSPEADDKQMLTLIEVLYRQSKGLHRKYPEILDLLEHVYTLLCSYGRFRLRKWPTENVQRFLGILRAAKERRPFPMLSGDLQGQFDAVRLACEMTGTTNWRTPLSNLAEIVRMRDKQIAAQRVSLVVSWAFTAVGIILSTLFGVWGLQNV